MRDDENLRILITKQDDQYVAEGLEVDVFTQADSIDEVMAKFAITMITELIVIEENERPIAPAPDHVFNRWEKALTDSVSSPSLDTIALQLGTSIEARMVAA